MKSEGYLHVDAPKHRQTLLLAQLGLPVPSFYNTIAHREMAVLCNLFSAVNALKLRGIMHKLRDTGKTFSWENSRVWQSILTK